MNKLLLLLLLLLCFDANAFIVSGTRFIVNEGDTRTPIVIKNNKNIDISVQSWLSDYPKEYFSSQEAFKKFDANNKGLAIAPSFFKVEANKNKTIYINKLNTASLASDRESLLGIYIRGLPDKNEVEGNALYLAQQILLKVIYRPKGLKLERKDAEKKLQATCKNSNLFIINPTPYIFSISNLFLNGRKKEFSTIITPGDNGLSEVSCSKKLEIEFINDFGGMDKYVINYIK
ncbi:TPA: fimbrial biogenesis chaperone [Photobacterium damselae]